MIDLDFYVFIVNFSYSSSVYNVVLGIGQSEKKLKSRTECSN